MAMPGRFKCYSCGYEHVISEREYVELKGERFARSSNCPENLERVQETVNDREFFKILHAILNPGYAYA
ncbi:MAG: hypothetical protein MUP55_04760 [Candidatus Aenigmarchaeota archaeon]|nr:hypothetical protein [Candidatus Aenigmarchaeota archaeon]